MYAYIATGVTFVVGFVLRARGWRWWPAFCVSCLPAPIFVAAIALMKLEGWEWWPVAIIFGSLYGAASGALGVIAATVVRRVRSPKHSSSESSHGA